MAYTDGAPSGLGYISIEQKDGEYTFSMVAGKLNACIRNQLKASVERTEKAITITSIIALA